MCLIENERLPVDLGWSRPGQIITMTDLDSMLDRVVNATGSSPEEAAMIKRADTHVGHPNNE